MTPVTFTCVESSPLSGREIGEQILDLSRWPEFRGYGPLPGIRSAEFETRPPEIVGTCICVNNTDDSSHVEEVIE